MKCEACGEDVPAERAKLHARGLDGARPACPKQDIVEIAMRARVDSNGVSDWQKQRLVYGGPEVTRLQHALWTL